MITEILKAICIFLFVVGLNEHFQTQQNKRKIKNLYPVIQKYDSLAMVKFDSLLTNTR